MSEVNEEKNLPQGQASVICPGHSRPVPDLCFSPVTERGVFILSSCLDGKPMLRDGKSGDWIGTFEGHKGAVWCSRFNSDATRVVTASAEWTSKLFSAESGDELHTFEHSHVVKTVEFANDGNSFYSGGHKKKLRVWDLVNFDAEPEVCDAGARLTQIAVAPRDENVILTGGEEKGISLWDRRTLKKQRTLETKGNTESLEIAGDKSVMVSTGGQWVSFWNTETFELIKEFEFESPLYCAALHPNKQTFAVGQKEELWAHVCDYETGKQLLTARGHHGPVRCLQYAPDGLTYASGSEDGTVRLWSAAAPEPLNNGGPQHDE